MAVRNAALEQLYNKVIEEEFITVFAKATGEEPAAWAATRAEENNSIRHCIPHLHCAIRYPSRCKLLRLSNFKFTSTRIVSSTTVTWISCAL